MCCLHEPHFKYKETYRLKVNGRRKIYHASMNEKKAGVDMLLSERADSKARKVIRDKIERITSRLVKLKRSSNQSSKSGVGKHPPMSQIWPVAYFCTAQQLKMVLYFKWLKKTIK